MGKIILIVSGGDLVGKSTFCRAALAAINDCGLPHMAAHLSRPPACFDYYGGYLEMIRPHVVYDRFHLDALAYRKCDDHESSLTPLKYDLVDAAIREACGFIVLVTADEATVRERHAQRGDDMYDIEHIVMVNSVFNQMAEDLDGTFVMRDMQFRYRIDAVVSDQSCWKDVIDAYVSRFEEWRELVG